MNASPKSKILLEELFAAGDDRFLDAFIQFDERLSLEHFTQKWVTDKRPWAKQQWLVYLHGPLNHPGHETVVKHAFRYHESAADLEMLGHWMVALDRIVRRVIVTQFLPMGRGNWTPVSMLRAKSNPTRKEVTGRTHSYKIGWKEFTYPLPDIKNKPGHQLFSQRTRAYLRRRIWRFFRQLSRRDPEAYVRAIASALSRYRDDDFQDGPAVIDNWSLMHAAYFHSDVIAFTGMHTNLLEGKSLADLRAAPYCPEAWQQDVAAECLWELLQSSSASLIRTWALECLRDFHQDFLDRVPVLRWLELLSHPDPSLQELASEAFVNHDDLPNLSIADWLKIVHNAAPSILPILIDAMQRHVRRDRLGRDELIELASARPSPLARLGLDWMRESHTETAFSIPELQLLGGARCDALATERTRWAIDQICKTNDSTPLELVEFFDTLIGANRAVACGWLVDAPEPIELAETDVSVDIDARADADNWRDDAGLWARLAETPHDEVREALVQRLDRYLRKTKHPDTGPASGESMAIVWTAVILSVHRGGRSKPKAIRQLACFLNERLQSESGVDLAATDPKANGYLTVLVQAARSIRAPERAAATSELVLLSMLHPRLADELKTRMPEITWPDTPGVHDTLSVRDDPPGVAATYPRRGRP
ncbi:MAG: hypothetical protein AAF958_11455 [Planctomycetota bacterium]